MPLSKIFTLFLTRVVRTVSYKQEIAQRYTLRKKAKSGWVTWENLPIKYFTLEIGFVISVKYVRWKLKSFRLIFSNITHSMRQVTSMSGLNLEISGQGSQKVSPRNDNPRRSYQDNDWERNWKLLLYVSWFLIQYTKDTFNVWSLVRSKEVKILVLHSTINRFCKPSSYSLIIATNGMF